MIQNNSIMSRHLGKTSNIKFLYKELKTKVIDKFESGQSTASIAEELDLTLSAVKIILRSSECIKKSVKNSTLLKSTFIPKKHKGPASEMEKLLIGWIRDQLKNNEPISLSTIKSKAKSIFEEQKLKFPHLNVDFVSSDDWLKGFRVRSNIQDLKFCIYLTGAEHLKEIISEDEYTAQQVYCVSEIVLPWKSIPGREQLEDKVTVMVGCNAKGDHKLKPLFFNPLYLKTNAVDETTAIFSKWFYKYFIRDVQNYCEANCIPIKILLIINDIPWHSICVNHPNVKILLLPRKLFLIQPMNQGVISIVRACYVLVMLAEVAEGQYRGQAFNEFLVSYTKRAAMKNIAEAWEITNSCLNASWKKLCPYFVNEEYSENGEKLTRDILQYAELLHLPMNFSDVIEFFND